MRLVFNDYKIQNERGKEFFVSGTFIAEKRKINLVVGGNGSGKTTFVNLLASILGSSALSNIVKVEGEFEAHNLENINGIGFIRQEPIDNFISTTIAEEIILPISNYGYMSKIKKSNLKKALKEFGLSPAILKRKIQNLSAGELQLATLGIHSLLKEDLLLIDEGLSRLDDNNKLLMLDKLEQMCKETFIVAVTHIGKIFASRLNSATINVNKIELENNKISVSTIPTEELEDLSIPENTCSITVENNYVHMKAIEPKNNLFFSRQLEGSFELKKSNHFISIIDLEPRKGMNVIYGKNGSGKSTLGKFLSGWIKNNPLIKGRQIYANIDYEIEGLSGVTLSSLFRKGLSAYIPGEPVRWLSEDTVKDEINLLHNTEDVPSECKGLLSECGIALDRKVSSLSYGQQKIVSIVSIPPHLKLVVLDEPFADLSSTWVFTLANYIKKASQNWECCYICMNSDLFGVLEEINCG